MISDFTLIIPTHNRHKFLERLLNYYNSFDINFTIVILDSSDTPFSNLPLNKNFLYKHCPNQGFMEKIYFSLKEIKTSFSALCADDDFMIPLGIENCCNFLRSNNDYASAQGRVVRFESLESTLYTPDEVQARSINFDNSIDRVTYGMVTNYTQTFYSIHRTEFLKSIFSDARSINYSLIELFVTFSAHAYGKHKVIPSFYYIREENLISEGKSTVGIEQIAVYQKDKYKKSYNHFLATLNKVIKKCNNNISVEGFSEDIFNSLLLNFDKNIFLIEKDIPIIATIKNIFRPYYLKFFLLSKDGKRKNKRKVDRAMVLIEKSKKNKGYPFCDGSEDIKELNKIKFFIESYKTEIYNEFS